MTLSDFNDYMERLSGDIEEACANDYEITLDGNGTNAFEAANAVRDIMRQWRKVKIDEKPSKRE